MNQSVVFLLMLLLGTAVARPQWNNPDSELPSLNGMSDSMDLPRRGWTHFSTLPEGIYDQDVPLIPTPYQTQHTILKSGNDKTLQPLDVNQTSVVTSDSYPSLDNNVATTFVLVDVSRAPPPGRRAPYRNPADLSEMHQRKNKNNKKNEPYVQSSSISGPLSDSLGSQSKLMGLLAPESQANDVPCHCIPSNVKEKVVLSSNPLQHFFGLCVEPPKKCLHAPPPKKIIKAPCPKVMMKCKKGYELEAYQHKALQRDSYPPY